MGGCCNQADGDWGRGKGKKREEKRRKRREKVEAGPRLSLERRTAEREGAAAGCSYLRTGESLSVLYVPMVHQWGRGGLAQCR